MNRRELLKGLAFLGCGAVCGRDALLGADSNAAEPLRLRIVSYNIQIGREPGGSYSDPAQAFLDHTAARIADLKPDVAGLQEVDNKTDRSGSDVDQLAELAKGTGLIPTFAPKTELPGGWYGVGVLSKEKPIKADRVIMEGSAHPRALQICEFERFVFFNTHFPLKSKLREKAVEVVDEQAKKFSKPIIIVGDFNAEPDSNEILAMKDNWTQVSPEVPTFPADKPSVVIDYVFVRNANKITVHDARVVDDPKTSDHRPVYVDVTIE